jgi:hypothetical protein
MTSDKIREIKLRRWAARLGLVLHKSRNRRWSVDNYLGYTVIDANTNSIVAGQKYELTLDDVESILKSDETEKMERTKRKS